MNNLLFFPYIQLSCAWSRENHIELLNENCELKRLYARTHVYKRKLGYSLSKTIMLKIRPSET